MTKRTHFAVTVRKTDVSDVVIAREDRHKANGRREPTVAISEPVDAKTNEELHARHRELLYRTRPEIATVLSDPLTRIGLRPSR